MIEKALTHPNLKPFRQYGFNPETRSGNTQVVGNCPLCGKERKFYVNVDTKAWDCKVCIKSGGFKDFLQYVWEESKAHFKGELAKKLSIDRGLTVETLTEAGLGWFPPIKAYVLPILDYTGKTLHSLKVYKGKKLWATYGDSNILYNGFYLQSGYFNILLCEGEWDALATGEALKKVRKKSDLGDKTAEVAIAVPGAQTFKKEWVSLFNSANVSVLYDNDKAGKEGAAKVYNYLKPITKQINFIHWPSFSKDGEDMRDLYRKVKGDAIKFLAKIKKRLNDLPQDAENLEVKINNDARPTFEYKGRYIPAKDVIDGYKKYLIITFPEVIEIMFATMIANRAPGDPEWLFIVNNSGGTKSELIMSLDGVQNVTTISTLTSNTLISGMTTHGGGDPSLIPKLNGRVLTIKDYTTIFGMDQNEQIKITSQLRDAYDGKASKPFGNGTFRVFKSTFGIIAGVTPIIEKYMEGNTALGERFVRIRIPKLTQEQEFEMQRKAMFNNANEEQMRQDLSLLAQQVLEYDYLKDGLATIPVNIQELLFYGAHWAAMMRGSIERNVMGHVTHKANREIATRLTKVLAKLIAALALFRGRKEVTMEDWDTIKYVIYSTVPEMRTDIIKYMYALDPDKFVEPYPVSQAIGVTKGTTEQQMENLVMLGILEKNPIKMPPSYRINRETYDVMRRVELLPPRIKPKTEEKKDVRRIKRKKSDS